MVATRNAGTAWTERAEADADATTTEARADAPELVDETAGTTSVDDWQTTEAFESQAPRLIALSHPNIANYREMYWRDSGGQRTFLLTREHVPGESFAEMEATMTDEDVLDLAARLLSALTSLDYHGDGELEASLDPDDVIMTAEGIPVLTRVHPVAAIERSERDDLASLAELLDEVRAGRDSGRVQDFLYRLRRSDEGFETPAQARVAIDDDADAPMRTEPLNVPLTPAWLKAERSHGREHFELRCGPIGDDAPCNRIVVDRKGDEVSVFYEREKHPFLRIVATVAYAFLPWWLIPDMTVMVFAFAVWLVGMFVLIGALLESLRDRQFQMDRDTYSVSRLVGEEETGHTPNILTFERQADRVVAVEGRESAVVANTVPRDRGRWLADYLNQVLQNIRAR